MLCQGNTSVSSTFVPRHRQSNFKLLTVQRVSVQLSKATKSKRQLFKTVLKNQQQKREA